MFGCFNRVSTLEVINVVIILLQLIKFGLFCFQAKMSETSLFAELVKDRNMRELAMQRLSVLKDKDIVDSSVVVVEDNSQDINPCSSQEETRTPPPSVQVENIPVPKMESPPPPPPPLVGSASYPLAMDPTMLLPHDMFSRMSVSSAQMGVKLEMPNSAMPSKANTHSEPKSLSRKPLDSVNSVNRTSELNKVEPNVAVKSELETVKKSVLVSKPKSLTKLPMPPGINQNDLESIDSPPSKSPSPLPEKKTPPKKGIKDLPLPPGNLDSALNFYFIFHYFWLVKFR